MVIFAFILGSIMKVLPVRDEISEINALKSASRILIVTAWLASENIRVRTEQNFKQFLKNILII